jgi:hypothetical protein
MFDGQTEKLKAKTPSFTLVAHHGGRPHRRSHVGNKKLDPDGLADDEFCGWDNSHSTLADFEGASRDLVGDARAQYAERQGYG